jgi:hypothetical protein
MQTIQRNLQKGGTILEMVLTLVVFLSMFIGVFDIGEMFFVHQTLTDRARNAARWGAVNVFDATPSRIWCCMARPRRPMDRRLSSGSLLLTSP